MYWARGDVARALATLGPGLDARERSVSRVLSTGSEEQRRLFLAISSAELDVALSLQAEAKPSDVSARRIALLEVLRHKGRLLDAMSDTTRSLREHLTPDERAQFDELARLRTQIARAFLAKGVTTPEDRQRVRSWETDADRIEAAMAASSATFRAQGRADHAVRRRGPPSPATRLCSSSCAMSPTTHDRTRRSAGCLRATRRSS